jgi:hypothetical protein
MGLATSLSRKAKEGTKMRFYSFHNPEGFANTGFVYAWDSKAARSDFINVLDGEPIRANSVGSYARYWSMTQNRMIEPRPFSGEYWGIVKILDFYDSAPPSGWIGRVSVVAPNSPLDPSMRVNGSSP